MDKPLSSDLSHKLDTYWRAANYLSANQMNLFDGPLLRIPLRLAHVKPRFLGHWAPLPA